MCVKSPVLIKVKHVKVGRHVPMNTLCVTGHTMYYHKTGKFGGTILKYWWILIWRNGTVSSYKLVCVYICTKEILAEFNLAVGWSIRQTAKFNYLPNFPGYTVFTFAKRVWIHNFSHGNIY